METSPREIAEKLIPLIRSVKERWPVFLRTGHGSGKHEWSSTCCLRSDEVESVQRHVCALIATRWISQSA